MPHRLAAFKSPNPTLAIRDTATLIIAKARTFDLRYDQDQCRTSALG